MDSPKKEPLLFSNRAIDQYARGFLEEEDSLTAEDCHIIRLTFRQMGGSWESVAKGDPKAHKLLSQAVRAWGKLRS